MTNKEEFIEIFDKLIIPDFPDAKKLLNFLTDDTDFFIAPASMRNHSAVKGGLCLHSLNVYDRFMELLETEYGTGKNQYCGLRISELALISLCHDICKIFTYEPTTRNKKVNGQWVEEQVYQYNDTFPFGHGAKSVYYLQKYIHDISPQALQAVYYHMGGLDNPNEGSAVSYVFSHNPVAILLHTADCLATFLDEKRPDQNN